MKRVTLVFLCVLLFSLVAAPVVLALYEPIEDAWTQADTTSQNTANLHARSSVSGANCLPTTTSYMKFDLNSATGGISSVQLTLTYTYVNLGSGQGAITLYSVADDVWTETNVGTIKPAPQTVLSTITLDPAAPPLVGQPVTFPSSQALIDFFEAQRTGDKFASVAFRLTGCTAGAPEVRFASAENTTVSYRPQLNLLGPNSVTLTDASAQQANSLPLYAGLGALALVAVVGVGLSRRRMAAR